MADRNVAKSGGPAAPLVEARDIRKYFRGRPPHDGTITAADGVSLSLNQGETLGLVGESGCGKTTVGRCLLRLTRLDSGTVLFDGVDIYRLGRRELRRQRLRMQMIFQSPDAALNSRMTVGAILCEAIGLQSPDLSRASKADLARELLSRVNLSAEKFARYPRELSGGEKRRVGVARILAVEPEFIIADEPAAALDPSIKSQIINLLQQTREESGASFLVISHDVGLVRFLSDRIAVMYLGRIVEAGPVQSIHESGGRHPYTRQLLQAAAYISTAGRSSRPSSSTPVAESAGDLESEALPSGCRYHPRCSVYAMKGQPRVCAESDPGLVTVDADGSHVAACHFSEEGW